jgi:hypothetical protein
MGALGSGHRVTNKPLDPFRWQPIDTAPEGVGLTLEVIGPNGEKYVLPFACVRDGTSFVTEKGSALAVKPARWKIHFARRVALNPKYKKQGAIGARTPSPGRKPLLDDV